MPCRRDAPDNQGRAFSPSTLGPLRRWVARLNRDRHTGIFVTGQSMLDDKAGIFGRVFADRNLTNYGDHAEVWKELARLERPFLLITGDVHFGRIVQITRRDTGRLRGWELITSPAAICEGGAPLFSFDRDWRGHGNPEPAPTRPEDLGVETQTLPHPQQAWGAELETAWEVALAAGSIDWPTNCNALTRAKLATYADAEEFPNVALGALPANPEDVAGKVAMLREAGRLGVLDAVELLHLWLGFLCGVGRAPNPLLDGHGLPSAAAIEVVLAGAGFDMTPNLPSRGGCPEAIWQSAKWWQDWHTRDDKTGLRGTYLLRQKIEN